MSEDFSLVPGAKFSVVYRIGSAKDATLEGTYKGMAAIASETALVFETKNGLTYLTASSVVVMEQLEAAPEVPVKKSATDRVFYG